MNKALLFTFICAHALAFASCVPLQEVFARGDKMKVKAVFDIAENMTGWKATFTFSSPIQKLRSWGKVTKVSDTVWTVERSRLKQPKVAGSKFTLYAMVFLTADGTKPTGNATLEPLTPPPTPTPPPSGVSIRGKFLAAKVHLAVPCTLEDWKVNLTFSEAPLFVKAKKVTSQKLDGGLVYVLGNKWYNKNLAVGQVLKINILVKYAGSEPDMTASLVGCGPKPSSTPQPSPTPKEGSGDDDDIAESLIRQFDADLLL